MRPCSRKRPIMDLTRMFSESPGSPGRRQQMPRTASSIETPACEASERASMMSGSTSEFIFSQIAAGLPLRAKWVFAANMFEHALAQRQRRYRHLLDVARFGIAGDVVEHPRGVAPDGRIG